MKYAPDFSPDSARHHLVGLVERSGVQGGVLIDLGCGRAAVAKPLTSLGFDYVGTDIDADALRDIAADGIEVHPLDLRGDEQSLRSSFEEILAGRPLAGVLAIDALEHVADPPVVLRAISGLARDHRSKGNEVSLYVSIPNVSHFDVAAKLLIGRWDYLEIGLLDETHVCFFTNASLRSTMLRTGWREVDADDVIAPVTEQLFPADAPVVRPDAPARELLARLRRRGDDHAFTFQFIRRLIPTDDRDEVVDTGGRPTVFASVVITGADHDARLEMLLTDLLAQDDREFELILDPGLSASDPADRSAGLEHPIRQLEPAADGDPRSAAIAQAHGRYLCFLGPDDRVEPGWIGALRELARRAPGRVLRVGVSTDLLSEGAAETSLDDQYSFDYLHVAPAGSVALPAFALPVDALTTMRLRFDTRLGGAAPTVLLAEAIELCGLERLDRALVATPVATLREAEVDLDTATAVLEGAPLILPAGSATRLVDIRRRLVEALGERDELRASVAAGTEQLDLLEHQLERIDAELRRLQTWAARRPDWRFRRFLGRLKRSLTQR